jgi:type VI secretion system protein ImpJ
MFLRPHHFQAAARHSAAQAALSDHWDTHYNWGLRRVELDLDALANHRFVIRTLQARLRDGSLISAPEDGVLPALELQEAFGRAPAVTISLAVPVLRLGTANAAADGDAGAGRYRLDTQELEDENTGVNPQPVQVRRLNLRLLISGQDQAGYETLPLARVEKSASADAAPQLDTTYIPPLLACDAWKPLQAGILEQVYDRIGKKVDLLAQQVSSRGITFDSQAQGDPLIFNQLRVCNEAYALLATLVFAEGVHPLPMYAELCRLVGQLAIFGETRRPPELPRYDHDDLGGCFSKVKQYADLLLSVLVEPEYKERPFIGAGLRMQVSLEPAWLEPRWQLFVGVQSPLAPEECVRLLTRPGHQGLDMKIGSSERVDEIFRLGEAGLKFAHSPRPPRALPQAPGLVYFQISRESQQLEWARVQRSLALAVRLNENLVVGDIQGQRVLKVKAGSQVTTLQFTLYVAPGGTPA